jgi:hypothetical protein
VLLAGADGPVVPAGSCQHGHAPGPPDSVTHADVESRVADAYQRSLRGDRAGEQVIYDARNFGSARADMFEPQLRVLTSQYRAATSMVTLARSEQAEDPTMLQDLWPMLVVAANDPRDRQRRTVDQAIRNASGTVPGLLR